MVVIGGGVIGLELGSVYQRLGTQVTVVQHGPVICPFLDAEIAKAFQQTLKKQGIQFKLNSSVDSGENNREKGVKVNIKNDKGETEVLDCDVCLLSIGRHAFTEGLQLDKAGISAN